MDFFNVSVKTTKKNGYSTYEVYPNFKVGHSKDLMVRGKTFYALWNDKENLWSTDEYDIVPLVDNILDEKAKELKEKHPDSIVTVKYMENYNTGSWDEFKRFISRISDNYKDLDKTITFANETTKKEDYISRKLDYNLEDGDFSCWEELIGTLYSPEEKEKIEWAIGSIVAGDSKDIQKFLVFYGDAGSGKSTVLNIINKLFEGYSVTFDAKALTAANSGFSTTPFRDNPLIAIQHDGDLSRIEDNSLLNSIVSHEEIIINEKFKSEYSIIPKCFLFMASNKPVKITDAKSGLIRRIIDVTPTGNKLSNNKYNHLMKNIIFQRGAIAKHCLDVYSELGKHYYDPYQPLSMMYTTDPFFNFVEENYLMFKEEDGCTLKQAYSMYKEYCNEASIGYVLPQYKFREELKNYFKDFFSDTHIDGVHVRSYFSGFISEKFEEKKQQKEKAEEIYIPEWLNLEEKSESLFDIYCSNCLAQYASKFETPKKKWDEIKTTLADLDTHKLHYVKPQENHIVIDFDISDENGKNLQKNLEAASEFPPTYAEVSKGGNGLHLHYIYDGDVSQLSNVYAEHIEVKIFTGGSALRRRLSLCNDIPIATISSGLPMKEKKRMINFEGIKSEKALRSLIIKNLNKEIAANTKPSIEFIFKDLENAYASGLNYDVTDMRPAIQTFALNSTNNSQYCLKLVGKMKFKSDDISEITGNQYSGDDSDIVFYDVEVFPNLFLINWKYRGEGKKVVRMINPKPTEVEELMKLKLVGFNCRRYDNHILYAAMMGYSNEKLFDLSQRIVNGSKNAMFGEAYNVSYTDVYDFSNTKQSLKKWEIDLHIHHQELGLPWDQPVPEEKWIQVAEYCDNDVIATEAAFEYLSADWVARQILADLADMTVNDTTNSLTTRIIFGKNRKPQSQFNYRNLAEPVLEMDEETYNFLTNAAPEMMEQTHGEAGSLLPYFPDYKFEKGKSTYRGEDVGEGGYVYAEPGMYVLVALLDVMSMHPHSGIAEVIFGVEFTKRFKEIVDGRVSIKHEAWDAVNNMLDGKLTKYIQKVINGEMTSKQLADALKTAINAVYGQTFAGYDNAFKDPRNIDNIIAKRGALFMVDLKYEVQKRGFTVAHIKTDSIKIPNATPEIIQFVMDFGKRYGYTFEHEATYDRMCLVNDAVYIAKYASAESCEKQYNYIPGDNKKKGGTWTATGAQFAVPYTFKKLFSGEDICFEDMCETKSVTSSLYLDMNEDYPDVTLYETVYGIRQKHALNKELTKKELSILDDFKHISEEELNSLIAEGHNYRFIGRVGQFCPIKEGCGGGLLLREKDGKYYAVGGSKGYRWLESEMVKGLGKENDIDRSYYDELVTTAAQDISNYGDLEWFISDDKTFEETYDNPPWLMACGRESCYNCPNFINDKIKVKCKLGYNNSDAKIPTEKSITY